METTEAGYRPGDRVEWNPTGDEWEPATVHQAGEDHALIVLDENGQTLLVHPLHLRPAGPPSLMDAVREVRAAQDRRREQLARDLADTPDPALKMRIAELVAVREQCCASESDCDAWWELADLRWVLARRAESAGVS